MDEGTFVRVVGLGRSEELPTLTWVDLEGTVTPVIDEQRRYSWPTVSPDGSRITVRVNEPEATNL